MPTARISQRQKSSTQSGRARTDSWRLDFLPSQPKEADPLTGWAGNGDVREQIHLTFPSAEAAIAYCERQGWDHVVVPGPEKTLKLQAYADNFR
ncbi:MAG TPA: ETC complex I subunit [Sphingomonas sp.]|jgi:hypothetical protein